MRRFFVVFLLPALLAGNAWADRLPPGVQVIHLQPPVYANRPADAGPYSLKEIAAIQGLAKIGDADAQASLGIMLASRGDYAQAAYWYRRAGEAGVDIAAYNLGTMYFNGQGVPQDDAEGRRWFLTAARRGYPYAEFGLGLMYSDGQGVPRDAARGLAWYTRAARHGLPAAQHNLAVIYAQGDGVPTDRIKAYAWMLLASRNGIDAAGALAQIAAGMSPAEVAQATRLADAGMRN